VARVTGLTGLSDLLPHRRADAERFAALVDGRRVNGGTADHPDLAELARLAAALAPAEHRPDPAFRTALRERLVAEAASRPVPAARAAEAAVPAGSPAEAGSTPRWRSAVATVAVAAVVSGAGAAAASYRALPGDSLYGLKRQIESVELALAYGDLNRGRELLEQAESRLGEAERLAASSDISEPGTRADLVGTLADMHAATEEGSLALTDAYRESGDAEPLRILRDFADEQQERLRDLMALLDPALRDMVRPLLADLVTLERSATVLLGASTGAASGAGAAELGAASGDGWAVSMLLDRTAGATGDTGDTLADGTGSAGAPAGPGSGDSGPAGGLVDGVTGVLDGGSGSGSGGSAGTSGGGLGDAVGGTADGVGDTVDGVGGPVGGVADGVDGVLDPVTSPLVSSTPLPTSAPLPSLDPSTVTSPLPTVSVCVTLLGVETC
jgi:hypothetical protein